MDLGTGTRERLVWGLEYVGRLQVTDGLLVNVHGLGLDVVDPVEGSVRWSFAPESPGASVDGAWVVGDRVVVAVDDGPFLGVDRATGEQVWQSGEWRGTGQIGSPHGAVAGDVFVLTDVPDEPAVAVDPGDGSVRWRNSSLVTVTYVDGTLYGYGEEFDLAAVDAETGDLRWTRTYPCGGQFVDVFDGVGFTRCLNGLVRLDDDHEVVWHHDAGERRWSFEPDLENTPGIALSYSEVGAAASGGAIA